MADKKSDPKSQKEHSNTNVVDIHSEGEPEDPYVEYVPLIEGQQMRAVLRESQLKEYKAYNSTPHHSTPYHSFECKDQSYETIYKQVYEDIDCYAFQSKYTLNDLIKLTPELDERQDFAGISGNKSSQKQKEIHNNEEIKGRLIRSTKPRGQSSKNRYYRIIKSDNQLNELNSFNCGLNESQFIREFWSPNYGKSHELQTRIALIKSEDRYRKGSNDLETSLPKSQNISEEKRKKRRYRLHWAQSLLQHEKKS